MTDEMILVPRYELLAWSEEWLYENDPGDGTDCVTPFDTYLLKSPVGAHCTTCSCVPGMTPAVRFDTTPAEKEGAVRDHLISMGWTPPAETQAQGGGEMVWAVVGNKSGEILNVFHGTREKWLADTKYWPEHGFRTRPLVYGDTASPSAPVGVEGLHRIVDRMAADRSYERGQAVEDLRDALAALQPAATLPDVDDDDLTVAYMAGRHDGRKEARQSATVDEEQIASAIAIEDTGVSWHDVSPRDRTHYVKLARAALAAQQGGSDNDR